MRVKSKNFSGICCEKISHQGETFEGVMIYENGVQVRFCVPVKNVTSAQLYKALKKGTSANMIANVIYP